MKMIPPVALLAALALAVPAAHADQYVRGYTRNDGTYVQPHYRSNPDRSFQNNWSTYGNTNPYTGRQGTRRSKPSQYGGW